MGQKLRSSKRGFSGLEAAIVLIAFVIVAALFSSIILNMGFFSAEKAKSTITRGVTQASSAMTLSGNVLGKSADNQKLDEVIFKISLAVGDTPIDLTPGKFLISFTYESGGVYNNSIYTATSEYSFLGSNNGDILLDPDEIVQFDISLDGVAPSDTAKVSPNDEFKLEVKPPQGAILQISRKAPSAIKALMDLG